MITEQDLLEIEAEMKRSEYLLDRHKENEKKRDKIRRSL